MMFTRVIISLLVIFSMNDVTESGKWGDRISNIFTGIKKVKEVVSDILDMVSKFNRIVAEISQAVDLFNSNGQPQFDETLKKEHDEVMAKLLHVSNQIDDLSHVVSQGFELAIKEIISNMENIEDFTASAHELSNALETINIYYKQSIELRKHSIKTKVYKETLSGFVFDIFHGVNLPFMLDKVSSIIFKPASSQISKSFLDIFIIYNMRNYENRCDKNISPQQQLYYIYLSIMTIELKGMVTIAHGYSMLSLLHRGGFKRELAITRDSCLERVREYLNGIRHALRYVDREIRRCDAPAAIRDLTFIELEKFVQIRVFNENDISTSCIGNCEDYPLLYVEETEEKCFTIDGPLTICKTANGSSREYNWLKLADKDYHGRYSYCASKLETIDKHPVARIHDPNFQVFEFLYTHPTCDVCASSVYEPHRISIHAQYSDIRKNMIVTGVKFLRVNETLYIQIKQGKLLEAGAVHDNNKWEYLRSKENSDRWFRYEKRTMYLDDVVVAPNYVVTGVCFKLNNNKNGFKIIVRGTAYDFYSGKLNTTETKWFDPEDDQKYAKGYQRDRSEIPSANLDNPIHVKVNRADRYTNKFIKFSHTSLVKDAGQTTVPLFDAQPVTMTPAMPLNGIGVYYKAAEDFGGYLAPRIFTDSIEKYLDSSDD